MTPIDTTTQEAVDGFRRRAREWLATAVAQFDASDSDAFGGEGGPAAHRRAAKAKALQQALYEGGFAGITFPTPYGGLGLSVAHRDAFNDEVAAAGDAAVALFNLAGSIWGLSIGMIAPTMLEFATEEQKRTYIPQMLRGEKLWAQMLSEPTGGSDLAGAITRANRDGDQYLINGSKVWTSQADFSEMAVLLARTNRDVPKHRGLSMFIVSLDSPGLTINPLRLVSGGTGFCQEFFDDMPVPAANVLGPVDDGWNVASRLLVHERNTVGGGSHLPHDVPTRQRARRRGKCPGRQHRGAREADRSWIGCGRPPGGSRDPCALHRERPPRAGSQGHGQGGHAPGRGVDAPLVRLARRGIRSSDVTMDLAGVHTVIWPVDHSAPGSASGLGYLGRQGGSMASGTAEIQRNIISERVLGSPARSSTRPRPPLQPGSPQHDAGASLAGMTMAER